ncbi:hypothetical protein [Pontimicrobium sp. SW4]|uniref:Tetratricopeptide repeat protein n=1 Tax=Pontimicrobium sp. SW4 TaxID=3153519 RepID=A0AAU7BU02_9FLAO
MKKVIGILLLVVAFQASAQTNSELLKHYEAYYAQMKKQGDMQGVINALTHLNVLSPNQARLDTLAVLYMNGGKHMQALNTIGIDANASDSNMAVEVKAVSLQSLNEPQKALVHFEELFKRTPNIMIAYEMADIKIQLNNIAGATVNIEYGISNSKDDEMRTYYDSQTPYQVPAKAAFVYLKGLAKYKLNQSDLDGAIALLDEAIALAPNFNLALLSKKALEARKNPPSTPAKKDN